jgi:hypothetical protein
MPRFIICGATNGKNAGMLCLFDRKGKRAFFPPYPQYLGNVIAKALAGVRGCELMNFLSYDVSFIDSATRRMFGIVSAAETFHRDWLTASIIGAM